ncbi:MAG: MBL fold metallo-hydrolase [Vicinamibacteria bacterium]
MHLAAVVSCAVLWPAGLGSAPPAPPASRLRATHVAGSVHMIDAAPSTDAFVGGNVAVSVGPDGMFVVDTMVAEFAPELAAVLGGLSDRPIRLVVDTHTHFDHVGGNRVFAERAPIAAHARTRERMLASRLEQKAPPDPAGLPLLALQHPLTLHLNGEVVEIVPIVSAHSDTDVVVFFRTAKVVHMGDLYFAGAFPYIAAGGSMGGLIETIETVLARVPPDARIIPGHGALSNVAELRGTLAMLKETRRIVADGIRGGVGLEEMKKAKVLRAFDAWAAGNEYFGTDAYLEQTYKVLQAEPVVKRN